MNRRKCGVNEKRKRSVLFPGKKTLRRWASDELVMDRRCRRRGKSKRLYAFG